MSFLVKVTRCFQRKYLKYPHVVFSKNLWEKEGNQTFLTARKVLKNFSAGRSRGCLTWWGTERNSAPAAKHSPTKTQVRTICPTLNSTLQALAPLADHTESIPEQKLKHLLFKDRSVLRVPLLRPARGKEIPAEAGVRRSILLPPSRRAVCC